MNNNKRHKLKNDFMNIAWCKKKLTEKRSIYILGAITILFLGGLVFKKFADSQSSVDY